MIQRVGYFMTKFKMFSLLTIQNFYQGSIPNWFLRAMGVCVVTERGKYKSCCLGISKNVENWRGGGGDLNKLKQWCAEDYEVIFNLISRSKNLFTG